MILWKKNNTQALASQSALYASATDQHLITVAGFRSQQSEAENEIIKINSLPCFDVTFAKQQENIVSRSSLPAGQRSVKKATKYLRWLLASVVKKNLVLTLPLIPDAVHGQLNCHD